MASSDTSPNQSSGGGGSQRKSVKISKEIDLILCDYVERNAALWNPEDKNYHKSDKREELFEALAQSVNIPGSNLKERWGAIRHTFTKNVRKVEFSRQSTGEPIYRPSWPLFEKCLFLYEVVRRNLNKIKGNRSWMEQTNTMHSGYLISTPKYEPDLNIKYETDNEPCSSSLQLNTPEDSSSSYIPMTTCRDDDDLDMDQPPARKPRITRDDSTDNIQFLHPSDVMSNMTMDAGDDCDMFGRLVVTKLKKMTEQDAADAQIEILQVLKKFIKTNNNTTVQQQLQLTPQQTLL